MRIELFPKPVQEILRAGDRVELVPLKDGVKANQITRKEIKEK